TVAAYVNETNILLIDLRTGKLLHDKEGVRAPLMQLHFTAREEVVCRAEDGSIHYWSSATGKATKKPLSLFAANTARPLVSDLSPDGKRLAALDENGILRVLEGKKELWNINTADEGMASQVRFSPDGSTLALCRPGGIALLNALTGKRGLTLQIAPNIETHAQWSPNGRMIAVSEVGADTVTLWEVATGRKRPTL